MLAADQIAEAPEYQRTEGTHREPGGESSQREYEPGDLVDTREELHGDDSRQQSVHIKVVPFEHGAER